MINTTSANVGKTHYFVKVTEVVNWERDESLVIHVVHFIDLVTTALRTAVSNNCNKEPTHICSGFNFSTSLLYSSYSPFHQ